MWLTGSHPTCPGASIPWASMDQPQHCPERLLCHSATQNDHQPCEKGLRDLSRLWGQPLHTHHEARRRQSQVMHRGLQWENKGQLTELEIGKSQVRNNGKPFCHEVSQAVQGAVQSPCLEVFKALSHLVSALSRRLDKMPPKVPAL